MNVLQRHLDIILDSLVDAQQGILHPQIIPLRLIFDALVHDSPYCPPETSPLITSSKDSAHLLYRICEVHAYIHDNVLEYLIVLPLVNRRTYDVLPLIPLPVTLGEGTFVYIDAGEDILCFDRARKPYFTISEAELALCKTVIKNSYICKQTHPLLSSCSLDSCAVKTLQPLRGVPTGCETRVVHLSNTLWIPLQSNSWIYFAPHVDTTTILCRNRQHIDVNLVGVGRLSVLAGCKGYRVSVVLQANSVMISNATLTGGDLLSQAPLQHDCCDELGVAFNLTGISLDISHRHAVPLLDGLRYPSKKISDIEKEIAEQEKLNQQFVKHHACSIAICVIISIILVYAMYKLCMF